MNMKRSIVVFYFIVVAMTPQIFGQNQNKAARSKESKELYSVVYNEKIGFINQFGKIVIKPRFFDYPSFSDDGLATSFSEGLSRVRIGKKWGVIDQGGRMVIKPIFDMVFPFSEGVAGVIVGDKYGFIDKAGKFVIKPKYDSAGDFSEGLASVSIDNKWGFIDKTGKIIISLRFDNREYLPPPKFSEGLSRIWLKTYNKYGFIDHEGNIVIKPQFEFAGAFSEGLASVRVKQRRGKLRWGFIDRTGKIVIRPQFEDDEDDYDRYADGGVNEYFLYPIFKGGLARIKIGGRWGFINRKGEMAIQPKFDYAKDFSSGLASVLRGNKWGYINESGEIVIKPRFAAGLPFIGELASVSLSESSSYANAYINRTGKIVKIHDGYLGEGTDSGPENIEDYMTKVDLDSDPKGAQVYLIPLKDWQDNPDIVNRKDLLQLMIVSDGPSQVKPTVYMMRFMVLFELNGKKCVKPLDAVRLPNGELKRAYCADNEFK
jgi:hypothetical protein